MSKLLKSLHPVFNGTCKSLLPAYIRIKCLTEESHSLLEVLICSLSAFRGRTCGAAANRTAADADREPAEDPARETSRRRRQSSKETRKTASGNRRLEDL